MAPKARSACKARDNIRPEHHHPERACKGRAFKTAFNNPLDIHICSPFVSLENVPFLFFCQIKYLSIALLESHTEKRS
jgi:hypothetical protein|tara:strand:- start:160 stop:393 length:234 start_codon:yes stop_codon:yes gene_type:complete